MLASGHILRRGAAGVPTLEEVALPTPGVWPSGNEEGGQGRGRGRGGTGPPSWPQNIASLCGLPGTHCHTGPGPSPRHLMSCHSPALKEEGENRGGGRRPPKHRQPGWELPLRQGLVPWPQ